MIDWPAREHAPDVTGRPDEPWWTRVAITWMEAYLKPTMNVLEWGAGASTPWLAARCGRLLSIEHNPEFAGLAVMALEEAGRDLTRYTVIPKPIGPGYYGCVQGEYDAAIIDGRMRVHCCRRAVPMLKSGGILLLDNAERKEYGAARALLAGWPVVETNNGIWHTNIWTKPNAFQ